MAKNHSGREQQTRFLIMALVCLGTAMSWHGSACAQKRVSITDIAESWTARQKETDTARFLLSETLLIAKGTMPPLRPRRSAPPPPPAEDVSLRTEHLLVLAGKKVRYNQSGDQFDRTEGKVVTRIRNSAFDGTLTKAFLPHGLGDFPRGMVIPSTSHTDSLLVVLSPLFINYRGGSQELLPFNLSQMQASEEVAQIRGRPCIILKGKKDANVPGVHTLWLDSVRPFALMRYNTTADGRVSLQVDLDYETDPKGRATPTGWKYVYYQSDGSFRQSSEIKIKELGLNVALSPQEFAVEFPPGTIVTDMREANEKANYLVRPDGERRIINSGEKKTSYQQIANSDSGDTLKSKTGGFIGKIKYLLAFAVILIILLFVCLRRSLRFKTSAHGDS